MCARGTCEGFLLPAFFMARQVPWSAEIMHALCIVRQKCLKQTCMHAVRLQSLALLSSRTVLRFSIQMASTGPSRTIQVFWVLLLAARRHSTAKMPSVQSPVAASMRPNICGAVTACTHQMQPRLLTPISKRPSQFMYSCKPLVSSRKAALPRQCANFARLRHTSTHCVTETMHTYERHLPRYSVVTHQ